MTQEELQRKAIDTLNSRVAGGLIQPSPVRLKNGQVFNGVLVGASASAITFMNADVRTEQTVMVPWDEVESF